MLQLYLDKCAFDWCLKRAYLSIKFNRTGNMFYPLISYRKLPIGLSSSGPNNGTGCSYEQCVHCFKSVKKSFFGVRAETNFLCFFSGINVYILQHDGENFVDLFILGMHWCCHEVFFWYLLLNKSLHVAYWQWITSWVNNVLSLLGGLLLFSAGFLWLFIPDSILFFRTLNLSHGSIFHHITW